MREQNTGVEIIGVPTPQASTDDISEFISKMDGDTSHVLQDPEELWVEHDVISQPALVFVAADGRTITHLGTGGRTGLLWRVEDLLEGVLS